jgi:hypothetical protein
MLTTYLITNIYLFRAALFGLIFALHKNAFQYAGLDEWECFNRTEWPDLSSKI